MSISQYVASEVTGALWIYFVYDSYKKSALSKTDHCTWYLSTSLQYRWEELLRKYVCPEKFRTMIEAVHTGMMANVSVGGEVSESFSVTNGIKQGCVLDPTLFSIFLSAMFDEAFRDMVDDIYIQSRQSTDLFMIHTTSERRPRLLRY